jgi:hypothetical protein
MTYQNNEIGIIDNKPQQLVSITSFVKKFPIGTPVYIVYSFSGHGDVEMLVIPQYYNTGSFYCDILAVNYPLIPKGYMLQQQYHTSISIDKNNIKRWSLWNKKKAFLI